MGSDFITQEFLRNQPGLNIPILKEMRKLSAPTDKVDLTLMSRAQVQDLLSLCHNLTSEQKLSYANQLAAAIKEWRQFTSPVAQNVDGTLVGDHIIGHCTRCHPTCKEIGRTKDEWFNNLEKDVRKGVSVRYEMEDSELIDEKFQELKRNFLECEPYVLTHGDLNFTNIFVKDNKLEAIIDWEFSGYQPWWAERFLSQMTPYVASDELFLPLWKDIMPEWDHDTFAEKVVVSVNLVKEAWEISMWRAEHPQRQTSWSGRGFCDCKPYINNFKWKEINDKIEHVVKDAV